MPSAMQSFGRDPELALLHAEPMADPVDELLVGFGER